MINLLAMGPRVRGFKPGRGDGFLRLIKIRGIPSFGAEVKLEDAPCHLILRNVNSHWQV
jgi:hypothetical protein